ncbi:MAG: 2-dehydropantoate 2-reductase [Rhizobiales bacterium]|nr:2-dehydropantoate 2-reductase [Hyphomicrobiales bacterium]
MKIAVVGAGAVGCYFGALLVRAGHDVTFVGRKPHVDAINARGLLLEMKSQNQHLHATAITDVSTLATPELVLFSVKSADTERAGAALSSRLADDTVVLSLQNGVDNPQRLRTVINGLVIPTVVYVGAEMAGPGHVKHHGRGELVIGSSPRSEALAQTLEAAGIPITIADDIEKMQWMKLVTNCAYNALSAVANIAYGPMAEVEGANEFVASVVEECVAVARGSGVTLPDDMLEQAAKIPAAMPTQFSSTAQDLARGKPTEIDFLNGFVVRKGVELGLPTPSNFALQVMVKLAERGRAISLAAKA